MTKQKVLEATEKLRDDKYLQIITYLNKKKLHGQSNYFNCGELGIIFVYWYGKQWEHYWLIIKHDPTLKSQARKGEAE